MTAVVYVYVSRLRYVFAVCVEDFVRSPIVIIAILYLTPYRFFREDEEKLSVCIFRVNIHVLGISKSDTRVIRDLRAGRPSSSRLSQFPAAM